MSGSIQPLINELNRLMIVRNRLAMRIRPFLALATRIQERLEIAERIGDHNEIERNTRELNELRDYLRPIAREFIETSAIINPFL
jgi:hypothetical protein